MGLLDTFKSNMRRILVNGGHQLIRELSSFSDDPKLILRSVSREDQPHFLRKWWPSFNRDEKCKYILQVWKSTLPKAYYGYDWWLPLFEDIGYFSNCSIEKPTEDIVLYRGVEPNPKYRRGMSWTDNIEIAELIVLQKGGPSKIYQTTVKPEWILAVVSGSIDDPEVTANLIDRGKECQYTEYIIDYRKLNIDDIKEWSEVEC